MTSLQTAPHIFAALPPTVGARSRQLVARASAWRMRESRAFVDIAHEQPRGLGAPQPGRAEQMQEREVVLALAGTAVGHPQQPRPFVVIERPWLAAADAGRADPVLSAASAPTVSARPRSAERVLGDRGRRTAGALERLVSLEECAPGSVEVASGDWIYAQGTLMADLVDRIRKELNARIGELRPLAAEFERLQRAAAALARTAARSVPGRGADAPASADTATRTARAPSKRAVGSSPRQPAARTAAPRRRGGTARPRRAPRGQNQAKVLAALSAAPGSTAAAVAKASGIPTPTVSATIARLVKQHRVRRLDDGGYAIVETSAAPNTAATTGQRDEQARAEPTAEDQPPASPTTE